MPSYEASGMANASTETVWAAWTDVVGWSAADHIEFARIDGEFRVGAVITSKARGFPSSSLTVTRADHPSLWVDESRFPGMRMTFDHMIEPGDSGTRLTERVRISGPLGHALGPLLRRRLEVLFAASVTYIARRAEAESSKAESTP